MQHDNSDHPLEMNPLMAMVCVAMALLGPIIPMALFIGIALLIALIATWALGSAKGLSVIAPLFLFKAAPELIPPLFALIAIMFIFDEDERRPLSIFGWSAGAIMAGLSYSSLTGAYAGSFSLGSIIIVSMVIGLAMAWPLGAPPKSLASISMRSHIAVLLIYGLFGLRWNGFMYGESFLVGLLVCSMLGVAAYKEKKIDKAGMVAGVILGSIIYFSLGIAGFVLMFFFIMFSLIATSVSANNVGDKSEHEMRGAGNAFANLAPSSLFALLSLMSYDPFIFKIGFCASLGAALSDTVSSELGRGARGKPRDIFSWEEVETGSNGAVSLLGLLVALLAAIFIGTASGMMEVVSISGTFAVVIGAMAGNLTDSGLGSAFENAGLLTNNQVNGYSVLAGGMSAMLIGLLLI